MLILVKIMDINNTIYNDGTSDMIVYGMYTSANYVVWERIVSEAGGGVFLDMAKYITGALRHVRNGSGQQWGVYRGTYMY